jgi:hypothetical protein
MSRTTAGPTHETPIRWMQDVERTTTKCYIAKVV